MLFGPAAHPPRGWFFERSWESGKCFAIGVRHKWKIMEIIDGKFECFGFHFIFLERILPKVFLEVVFYFVISVDKMGRLAWGYITHGNGR